MGNSMSGEKKRDPVEERLKDDLEWKQLQKECWDEFTFSAYERDYRMYLAKEADKDVERYEQALKAYNDYMNKKL